LPNGAAGHEAILEAAFGLDLLSNVLVEDFHPLVGHFFDTHDRCLLDLLKSASRFSPGFTSRLAHPKKKPQHSCAAATGLKIVRFLNLDQPAPVFKD
jgi:hypothetical protein